MKLKALSHYENDKSTRYGDCILGYNETELMVYDCGHERHAEEVMKFLHNSRIDAVKIIISHNDADHTDGVLMLMECLNRDGYSVTVYTSLYLKYLDEIYNALEDGRRKKNKTAEHILELFDHIADIVNTAEGYGFSVYDAQKNTKIGLGEIVGPSKKHIIETVVTAIESDGDAKVAGETVMNATSVQVKCVLDDLKSMLLCGDASPSYIENIEQYDIIQLPHHGQLSDAEVIFDMLDDPYQKKYFISDNTGSGNNSGGSDDLVKKMKENRFSSAYNTKDGVVNLPMENNEIASRRGVTLGCFGL